MNKKRILVICLIIILFIICYSVINTKYDRLARYPFGTEEQRVKIEKKLTDKEIEYIVEYAIEPEFFIEYLDCYHFNIYHVSSYEHFRNLFSSFNRHDAVSIVERLILLNKDDDTFYNSLIVKGQDYAVNVLRTYIW